MSESPQFPHTNESNASPEALQPIDAEEEKISYLGVTLEKAQDRKNAPSPDHYKDYINDDFSLDLQKNIAVSFLQGDPLLIEGGTSIGKTTTVKKMCSELGWEVHYANLNGATDVEDLMGRYIPNPQKSKEGDPEYKFADGKVTSGLRQEEGKVKVIILDELNAASPNILIRLHEVLDALERDGDIVLSEDASEVIETSKGKTKIIALMNPPGKGFLQRETLDPAQLRRWVYRKEATELPKETFSHATDALFGLAPLVQKSSKSEFLNSNEVNLTSEQLAEIPGMSEILSKYKEFHSAAKELVAKRKIGADQPQPFSYDDRVEPRRVRNFINRFYRGDINQTFQDALRYYYIGKVLDPEDKAKLEELLKHVAYVPPKGESKRKGLEQKPKEKEPIPVKDIVRQWPKKFTQIDGGEVTTSTEIEMHGVKVGDKFKPRSDEDNKLSHLEEVLNAKELTAVGFTNDGEIVTQLDKGQVLIDNIETHKEYFEKVESKKGESRRFIDQKNGQEIITTGEVESGGYKIGDKLKLPEGDSHPTLTPQDDLTIVGFDKKGDAVIQIGESSISVSSIEYVNRRFHRVEGNKKGEPKKFSDISNEEVVSTGDLEFEGYKVGDTVVLRKGYSVEGATVASTFTIVGITEDGKIITQIDRGEAVTMEPGGHRRFFEKVEDATNEKISPQIFQYVEGGGYADGGEYHPRQVESTGEKEKYGYKIGDKLKPRKSSEINKSIQDVKDFTVAGFTTTGRLIIQCGEKGVCTDSFSEQFGGNIEPKSFERVIEGTGLPTASVPKSESIPQGKVFIGFIEGTTFTSTGETERDGWKVGQEVFYDPDYPPTSQSNIDSALRSAEVITIVGFTKYNQAILEVDSFHTANKVIVQNLDGFSNFFRNNDGSGYGRGRY